MSGKRAHAQGWTAVAILGATLAVIVDNAAKIAAAGH